MSKSNQSSNRQPLPTSITELLAAIDPDDALHALEEWYETYDLHCIDDGVPGELHDSIFTLHKNIRALLQLLRDASL